MIFFNLVYSGAVCSESKALYSDVILLGPDEISWLEQQLRLPRSVGEALVSTHIPMLVANIVINFDVLVLGLVGLDELLEKAHDGSLVGLVGWLGLAITVYECEGLDVSVSTYSINSAVPCVGSWMVLRLRIGSSAVMCSGSRQ